MQINSGNRIAGFTRTVVLGASALCLSLAALPASAADYVTSAPAIVDNTVCSQQSVLRRVVSRFGYQVRHVPELPQVAITAMSDVRLNRYEPKTNPAEIERTYCKATAVLSDGQYRSVWYLVEEGQGFVGVGRNVEFCVEGFDRWYVYDATSCRVLR